MSHQKMEEGGRWPAPAGWEWTTVDEIGNIGLG